MKLFLVLFVASFIVLFINGCESKQQRQEQLRKAATTDSLQKATNDSLKQIKIKVLKERIDSLKTKFDYTTDVEDFTNIFWYEPKNIPEKEAVVTFEGSIAHVSHHYIKPMIYSSGMLCIRSFYRDENWLYHQSISASINGKIIQSRVVPLDNERNKEKQVKGWYDVKEEIFFNSYEDNGILEAIALSDKHAYIEIKFSGEHENKIFSLTKKEIQAIKDSYELSNLLREIGGLE